MKKIFSMVVLASMMATPAFADHTEDTQGYSKEIAHMGGFRLFFENTKEGGKLVATCALTGLTTAIAAAVETAPLGGYVVKASSIAFEDDVTGDLSTNSPNFDELVMISGAVGGGAIGSIIAEGIAVREKLEFGDSSYSPAGEFAKKGPVIAYFGTRVVLEGMAKETGCLKAFHRLQDLRKESERRDAGPAAAYSSDRYIADSKRAAPTLLSDDEILEITQQQNEKAGSAN